MQDVRLHSQIDEAVANACKTEAAGLDRLLLYRSSEQACVVDSQEREEGSTPDAYLSIDGHTDYATIGVIGEYKKTASAADVKDVRALASVFSSPQLTIRQNIAKITASMANSMRFDPRRRYVLGFTIENTDMKLWFCDRAHTICSEPFDFTTVSFILAYKCAHRVSRPFLGSCGFRPLPAGRILC